MIAEDFKYLGKSLKDMGYILTGADDEDVSGLAREVIRGETNSARYKTNFLGAKYTDTLVLNFTIFKNPCMGENEYELSMMDLRRIERWLTSSKYAETLYVTYNNGIVAEYYGLFSDVETEYGAGVNSLKLTFICNTPFAHRHKEVMFQSVGTVKRIISCDSDELNDYVYPLIYINNIESNSITIKNITDNSEMNITVPPGTNSLEINSELKTIKKNGVTTSLFDIGWNVQEIIDYNNVGTGSYKIMWPRLLSGKNEIEFTGRCDFDIEYKEPFKIGGWSD